MTVLRAPFRAADGDEFTVSHGTERGTRWTSMEHTECVHRGRCPWDGLPEFVRLPNPSAATVSARVLQAVGRDHLDMYGPRKDDPPVSDMSGRSPDRNG